MVFSGFKNGIFPIKPIECIGRPDMLDRVTPVVNVFDHEDRSHLKILTSKQMLEGLPIAHAQLKAGNISENFLNETRQIIYFLY